MLEHHVVGEARIAEAVLGQPALHLLGAR
jgi:hypothetical protein